MMPISDMAFLLMSDQLNFGKKSKISAEILGLQHRRTLATFLTLPIEACTF